MDHYCLSYYQKEYNKLQCSLEKKKDDKKKFAELKTFSEKYYVLPEEWKLLEELHQKLSTQFKNKGSYDITNDMRTNTFNVNPGNEHTDWIWPQSMHLVNSFGYEENLKMTEEALKFPHKNIKLLWHLYQVYSPMPLTNMMKNNVQKIILLSDHLQIEMDDNQWLEIIQQITYDKAVIANIELRLQQKQESCLCLDIWKYYIEFMKTQNPIDLLNVYRRYCRLYMDDHNVREEYHKEIERFGESGINVSEYWKDVIKFEMDFRSIYSANTLLEKALKTMNFESNEFQKFESIAEKEDIFSKFKNMIDSINAFKIRPPIALKRKISTPKSLAKRFRSDLQKTKLKSYVFPSKMQIRRSLASYIMDNANPQVLYKLQSSCKYFFAFKQYPICYRLLIEPNAKDRYVQQSLFLPNSFINFPGLKNMVISNNLTCKSFSKEGDNGKILSVLRSKIYKCEAKCLNITNQTMMEEDFIFYIESGKILFMWFSNVDIIKKDGTPLSPTEIKDIVKEYNIGVIELCVNGAKIL